MKIETLATQEIDERDQYLLFTIGLGWEKLPLVLKAIPSWRRPYYRTQLAEPISIKGRPRTYPELLTTLANLHQLAHHLTAEQAQLSVMVNRDLYINLLQELGEVRRYDDGSFVPLPSLPFITVLDSLKVALPQYKGYRPHLKLKHVTNEYALTAFHYIHRLLSQ